MEGLSRRRLIGGAALATLTAFAARVAAAPQKTKLPNILWFVSEDNFPLIGAYGDKLARTPTIDKLARGGLLYDRAYCTSPVCGPSRFTIVTGMHPERCGSSEDFGSTDEVLPYFIQGYPAIMRAAGYYCTNNAKKNYNSQLDFVDMWDESSNKAHWRNRPKDKPFLAVFNTFTTHESCLFRPLSGNVKPEQIEVPPYLPDTPGVRKDFTTFYNAMEKMDGELAARIKELEDEGVADDTIIFYYSDNGGITPRGKRYCYELGTRCALVIHIPPKWAHLLPHRPGTKITQPVSFCDLTPTLLSIAGIQPPGYIDGRPLIGPYYKAPAKYAFSGRDRMDERYDLTRAVTDGRYRYIRNYAPHRPWGQHVSFMFQAAGYQDWQAAHLAGTLNPVQDRFWGEKPHEELYDTVQDFHQIDNLADNPAHRAKLEELRSAMDRHMVETNDNGLIPEGCTIEGYINSRRPGAYPIAEIMALAFKTGERNPSHLPEFTRHLKHEHECMRYWAAQGMLILGRAAKPALEDILTAFGREQSVAVRISLCETLVNLDNDRKALRALGTILDEEDDGPYRMQAINALTYLGERSRPVIAAIRRSSYEDHRSVRKAAQHLLEVLDGTYDPYKHGAEPGGFNPFDPEVDKKIDARPYD